MIDKTGNLSKMNTRIMGQTLINKCNMQKNGGGLFNLRNEIRPKFGEKYGIKK